ncbi:DUF692 domain-containing protein [Marinomonas sp. 15G1-11]|uniref:DUF692 domain-containing protein n=1 Tax=Marinomonas phaeophyticola TaxID=3004091 RepID=A0ABT4JYX0_9GAMM|nr:DUF692 domain-containing protein [Marinomonas sp. 15G1-11]MCZ2722729.1 DUF692 domain-containing protein [Marinomonas sp. 15G1-11]
MSLLPLKGLAGINLKPQHYDEALNLIDSSYWFEFHTENFFVGGGPRLDYLQQVAQRFPISLHGVGASLGNVFDNFSEHLREVRKLVKQFNPALVSEHATWSAHQESYFADLLPLPKTDQALQQLCDGIDRYQNAIERPILIENPSNYLDFVSELDEPDFLMEAVKRTGCGLLVDVNNLYISHRNCGLNIQDYFSRIDPSVVGEIHIAGFSQDEQFADALLIDSHGAAVDDQVWHYLSLSLKHFGPVPVLLERDDNIPSFNELRSERDIAQALLNSFRT